MSASSDTAGSGSLVLSELPRHKTHEFKFVPDRQELREIAKDLKILAVEKARLQGTLTPTGRRDWDLKANVGATATQPCVVSLAPVRTRLDETIYRDYRESVPEPDPDTEMEIPEEEETEELPARLDLRSILVEALALALPAYPRADDAALEQSNFSAPEIQPMTDADAHPFAGLAALRDKEPNDNEK